MKSERDERCEREARAYLVVRPGELGFRVASGLFGVRALALLSWNAGAAGVEGEAEFSSVRTERRGRLALDGV